MHDDPRVTRIINWILDNPGPITIDGTQFPIRVPFRYELTSKSLEVKDGQTLRSKA